MANDAGAERPIRISIPLREDQCACPVCGRRFSARLGDYGELVARSSCEHFIGAWRIGDRLYAEFTGDSPSPNTAHPRS